MRVETGENLHGAVFASVGRRRNLTVASGQPNTNEKVAPTPTKVSVPDHHNPAEECTTFDLPDGLPARGDTIQSTQARHSLVGGKDVVSATVSSVTIRMTPLIYSLRNSALKVWISFLSPSPDGIPRRR